MRRGHLAWMLAVPLAAAWAATPAFARKTNEPLYEDPYDLAAGGASLTRASKEGMIFSNPALLPEGGKFFRWLGVTPTLITNKESVDTAKQLLTEQKSSASQQGQGSQQQSQQFVDKLLQNPIYAGEGTAASLITNNFAMSVFSRTTLDISAHQYGSTGLPEVDLQGETYDGAAIGTGIRTPLRWLSFGVTGKYVEASEPTISASLTDQAEIQNLENTQSLKNEFALNHGVGMDVGSLIFLQGSHVDLSLAGKVDDVGDTKLSGSAPSPKVFKQVESAGLGLDLHTGADDLHLAVDYRDLQDVYGDPLFKRVYAGAKLMLHTYIGVAAGYYDGYPSMGAEIDLILMRLGFTQYTRELGDHVGVAPRHVYMVSLSVGI